MAFEIEIKAHARAGLKERIDAYCAVEGEAVIKDDTYYCFPGDERPRFRIRRENDRILVSAKRNLRLDGLECNREVEFWHDDAGDLDVMHEMALMLGNEVLIHKHKAGWSWMKGEVHIELLDVRYLGWFLEMEVISAVDGIEANSAHYESLFRILHDLDLNDDDIEPRSYQEMLRPFEPRG